LVIVTVVSIYACRYRHQKKSEFVHKCVTIFGLIMIVLYNKIFIYRDKDAFCFIASNLVFIGSS